MNQNKGTGGGGTGPKKVVYQQSKKEKQITIKGIVVEEKDKEESSRNRKKSVAGGPEEWIYWCSKNNVLGRKPMELDQYEIDSCRRHFIKLKVKPSDEGVPPKNLADSFYHTEVFGSLAEALSFCQKLPSHSNYSLITFNDLLNVCNSDSLFKKNKVIAYMRCIAAASSSSSAASSASSKFREHQPQSPSTQSSSLSSSSSPHFRNDFSRHLPPQEGGGGTISSFVNGATELLSNVFTRKSTPGGSFSLTLVSRQKKITCQRQESGDTFRNYSLRRGQNMPPTPSHRSLFSPTHQHNNHSPNKHNQPIEGTDKIIPAVKSKTSTIKIYPNRIAAEQPDFDNFGEVQSAQIQESSANIPRPKTTFITAININKDPSLLAPNSCLLITEQSL